jgi:hypothetical protein
MMAVRHLEADEPTAAAPSLASAAPLCVDTPILLKGLLVVVVFNNLFKANVPKLKAMYSQVDMVFCSSEEVYDEPGFIHAPLINEGKLSYQCTIVAMQLFPFKSGYLTIGDDVLISFRRLLRLDPQSMWRERVQFNFSTNRPNQQGGEWALWSRLIPMGYQAAVAVEADPALASEYRNQLKSLGWQHTNADVFYFPSGVRDAFLSLAPIFLRHQVYFSNAVTTLMELISKQSSVPIGRLQGHSIWSQPDRLNWMKLLPEGADYYHPLKLSLFDADNYTQLRRVCSFVRGDAQEQSNAVGLEDVRHHGGPTEAPDTIPEQAYATHAADPGTMPRHGSATSGRLFEGGVTRKFTLASGVEPELRAPSSVQPIYPSSCVSEKWAVVTTIFEPSRAIEKVAALLGWCLVIVADKKTPDSSYTLLQQNERVVYVSVAAQQAMASRADRVGDFVKRLPWNHFARKNVGYLFAISHGAKLLFDFDDDNELKVAHPLPCDKNVVDCKSLRAMTAPTSETAEAGWLPTFNPYPLMGASTNTSWPRGFPLHQIKRQSAGWGAKLAQPAPPTKYIALEKIGVVQILADRDPDVDGIFRLTQKLPFYFSAPDKQASLLIPSGTYVPTNAQATLHTHNALWGALLPITVHGRVSDIWRGYATERIFKDLGLSIMFAAPRVDQIRNPHNSLADMSAEQDLYFKSGVLVDFLSKWTDDGPTLPGRMERLAIALYEREYIEVNDVVMQQQWIAALGEVGYQFPPVVAQFVSMNSSTA